MSLLFADTFCCGWCCCFCSKRKHVHIILYILWYYDIMYSMLMWALLMVSLFCFCISDWSLSFITAIHDEMWSAFAKCEMRKEWSKIKGNRKRKRTKSTIDIKFLPYYGKCCLDNSAHCFMARYFKSKRRT